MPKPLVLALAAVLLAGCTPGLQQVRPEIALPEHFDQARPEQQAGAASSAVWQAFGDPALDALLAQTLAANTTIAQAAARAEEARALSGLSRFAQRPTLTAGADAHRSRASRQDPFVPPELGTTETWRAGFDAAWEIDLFGGLRHASRAQARRAEAEAATLAAVRTSMVAETAQAYFALRGAQRREALAQQNLDAADEVLRIIHRLAAAGRLHAVDAARAQAQRDSLAAVLPQRERERVAQEQRLAVLTAQPLAAVRASLGSAPAAFPALPDLVATGTPEDWLRRRPDILAAERQLVAAHHDVGIEIAQYFPRLNLQGGFGWTGQQASALGSAGAQRWQWGPVLSWRFLDFGRVRQHVRAAEARADAAIAHYRSTVLLALEETENALAAFRAGQQAAVELGHAAGAAREAARLARLRFAAGADDPLSLLQTEQTRIELEDAAVQAETARATALAALYKALAGDFAAAAQTSASSPLPSSAPSQAKASPMPTREP